MKFINENLFVGLAWIIIAGCAFAFYSIKIAEVQKDVYEYTIEST